MTVKDGPLEGEIYELSLDLDEETSLRLPDGTFAIYVVKPDVDYPDSRGHSVRCLRFVGLDARE